MLAPQPGLDELDRLLEQAGSAGLAVAADVRGLPGQLPAGVDLAAYRVIQEALSNVRKHGGDTARLCLDRRADGVTIEVCDDGATPVPSADLAMQESADGVDEAPEHAGPGRPDGTIRPFGTMDNSSGHLLDCR